MNTEVRDTPRTEAGKRPTTTLGLALLGALKKRRKMPDPEVDWSAWIAGIEAEAAASPAPDRMVGYDMDLHPKASSTLPDGSSPALDRGPERFDRTWWHYADDCPVPPTAPDRGLDVERLQRALADRAGGIWASDAGRRTVEAVARAYEAEGSREGR